MSYIATKMRVSPRVLVKLVDGAIEGDGNCIQAWHGIKRAIADDRDLYLEEVAKFTELLELAEKSLPYVGQIEPFLVDLSQVELY
jgi:hypothetical protein